MYNRTFWLDHITDAGGKVIQQGTAMDQGHLNNIELAMIEAQITQDVNACAARLNQRENDENTQVVIEQIITNATLTNVAISSTATRNTATYNAIPVITAISGATTAPAIAVSAKQANGFKIQLTGTFTSVTLSLILQGGIL